MRGAQWLAAGLLVCGALSVSGQGAFFATASGDPSRTPARPGVRSDEIGVVSRPSGSAVSFRLSEAQGGGETVAPPSRPPAEPLSEEEARRVLDRLPPLTKAPRTTPFARREDSLPPPRTGRTIAAPFPPPEKAAPPAPPVAGPLEVRRRAPEGEVPLAPNLSVTFSQPMVALATQEALARGETPVHLQPAVGGEWRWVGTRTLLFQPARRLPMATEFRAVVPAGTESATGGRLPHDVAWSFATPPPRVVARHPDGAVTRPDAVMFAAFDQDVDPAAVLASIRVRAAATPVGLRLATEAEVAGDEQVARLAREAARGRWLAFVAAAPLPADATIGVQVGPGTPSAEGPRRTTEVQSWSFRTYGPFRVTRHECGWGGRCTPFAPWRIQTTNPVDPKSLRSDRVRVTPELPGLVLSGGGNQIVVSGRSRGRTSYRVSVSSEAARDLFGQPLVDPGPLTFAVGPAEPSLVGPRGDFLVLDPAGPRRVPVYSVGHAALRARVYAVAPRDWPAWHQYRQAAWRNESATPPGRLVVDTTVPVAGGGDELVETPVDVSPALADGLGQAVVVVEAKARPRADRRQAVRAWVQATHLGLDASVDGETLLAWATALADGRPLADVELSLAEGASGRTDASGIARLALADTPAPLLVARLGRDVAILPSTTGWWSEGQGFKRVPFRDTLRYFVFDDRGLYRPGEEVRVKGFVRRVGGGPAGDVSAPPGIEGVGWTLRDSLGSEVAHGEARLSPTSAFDLAVRLPSTMNLGAASLALQAQGAALPGAEHTHRIEVQEFRRPEFEVKASASEGPHVAAGRAIVTVAASYYAGGALPAADVTWRVVSRPGRFRPPNRDDFTFGTFVPWWLPWPGPSGPVETATFRGRTDEAGVHRLRIDFDPQAEPRPRQVEAEATVMDVNRQAWAARVPLLVHPALDYVGLRAERPFVRRGESLAVDVIVTDLDGRAVEGRRVALRAERLAWEQVAGEWKQVPKDVQERSLDSTGDSSRVRFEARDGGSWRVVARVTDEAGRANETEMPLWVAGGRVPPRRDLEEGTVTIVPDRREYRGGDIAHLLIVPPFAPAEALLTLRRSGLVREQRLIIDEASKEIEVPIEEAFTPDVHVHVAIVGQEARMETRPGAPPRPAFASGDVDLHVPPRERTLSVEVTPRETALAPGGETVLDLAVRDAAGEPAVDAEATVVVVDEAVLGLTGFALPDPLAAFYSKREEGVSDYRLRRDVLLSRPEDLAERAGGGAEGGVVGGVLDEMAFNASTAAPAPRAARAKMASAEDKAPEPIRARTDFAALALFAAAVPAGPDGRARVKVKLPDSLTRYRIMVVAARGARAFGSAEATLLARLPLMVRPSPPRFLNFGDLFELPVVVQNQTDRPMSVDVAVRARNAALTAGDGRRLRVPAHDRAEVRFPMAAALAGSARIQVAGVSGDATDAAEVELPVWTPATTEAFATYGQLDKGAIVQPVKAPANVEPSVGGLEVTTSSTALQALTDAVLYLSAYPFECSEQLSSRILAVAALRDVLAAFSAEGLPRPGEMEAAVRRDLERLRAMQNDDGGFGFWRRGEDSWPYVSIHVANALARARAKGFDVPEPMLERSRLYLREIERRLPAQYPTDVKRTLRAYALAVRALLGDADPVAARDLVREAGADSLSFEALGFVLPVLSKDPGSAAEVAAVLRRIDNGVTETAGAAHFAVSYEDGAYLLLHSDRRADAIVLEALVADQPRSDLVPKLAAGLLAHRTAGHWANTQENVFVLLALDRYFQAYEKATPDFVARAWLGDRYAGEQAFRGRTTERRHLVVPMRDLEAGTTDLVLAKEGPGRLYYRIGLRYAPESLVLDPLDRGFTVTRRYEALDDPEDVMRQANGAWRIRAGARVRVVLTMVAPTRRYHVALVDPLPAGLEAVNPALAAAERTPDAGGSVVSPLGAPGLGGRPGLGSWWWWSRAWFEHQNLRDDRVEAFASLLWEGVHEYRYVARATTPGTFVAPPAKAEEMYAPETFGRSGTDRVVVE
jgi:uncharacterized protein YfaS (alpha-2-macroglobulin family)